MNFLEFVASIVGSIAWPSAVFGSVFLFRKELVPLLPRLRVKHRDTEISFRLEEAKREAEKLALPPPDTSSPEAQIEQDKQHRIAISNPMAAIREARTQLEYWIRETAFALNIDAQDRIPVGIIVRELEFYASPTFISLLRDLLAIGTNTVFNPRSSKDTAEEAQTYLTLVRMAGDSLRKLKNREPGIIRRDEPSE